jgi:hypothetical protein
MHGRVISVWTSPLSFFPSAAFFWPLGNWHGTARRVVSKDRSDRNRWIPGRVACRHGNDARVRLPAGLPLPSAQLGLPSRRRSHTRRAPPATAPGPAAPRLFRAGRGGAVRAVCAVMCLARRHPPVHHTALEHQSQSHSDGPRAAGRHKYPPAPRVHLPLLSFPLCGSARGGGCSLRRALRQRPTQPPRQSPPASARSSLPDSPAAAWAG